MTDQDLVTQMRRRVSAQSQTSPYPRRARRGEALRATMREDEGREGHICIRLSGSDESLSKHGQNKLLFENEALCPLNTNNLLSLFALNKS